MTNRAAEFLKEMRIGIWMGSEWLCFFDKSRVFNAEVARHATVNRAQFFDPVLSDPELKACHFDVNSAFLAQNTLVPLLMFQVRAIVVFPELCEEKYSHCHAQKREHFLEYVLHWHSASIQERQGSMDRPRLPWPIENPTRSAHKSPDEYQPDNDNDKCCEKNIFKTTTRVKPYPSDHVSSIKVWDEHEKHDCNVRYDDCPPKRGSPR